jgi:hypothetical protein
VTELREEKEEEELMGVDLLVLDCGVVEGERC